MKIIISPTKQMNRYNPESINIGSTKPNFLNESIKINNILKTINHDELAKLMKMSQQITEDTITAIKDFEEITSFKNPAIFAYSGTVFKAIGFDTFCHEDLEFTKEHLYILSGKYGILRSSDEICNYRLEAKTGIKIDHQNLYSFWEDRISDYLDNNSSAIINLASTEYSKFLNKDLSKKTINIHFKVNSGEKLRTVGYYSKVARGKMVNEIIKNRIEVPELIKKIEVEGFKYSELESSELDWYFIKEKA